MPSSSSSRSSTAHCVSAPGAGTCPPTSRATALSGASRSSGTVVSSSRKPRATALAASAASSSGWSTRFVTWAWIEGVRRTRIFCIADSSSTGASSASTRASLAGVMPAASRVTPVARRCPVHERARERDVVERHRLLGDREVDAAARDELVEQVEIGLRLAVELDDAAVLDAQRGLGIVRARERDQPERGVLGHEVVAADGPRRVELRAERGARAHGAYGSGRAIPASLSWGRQEAGSDRPAC